MSHIKSRWNLLRSATQRNCSLGAARELSLELIAITLFQSTVELIAFWEILSGACWPCAYWAAYVAGKSSTWGRKILGFIRWKGLWGGDPLLDVQSKSWNCELGKYDKGKELEVTIWTSKAKRPASGNIKPNRKWYILSKHVCEDISFM